MPVRYFEDVAELPDNALVFWVKRPGTDDVARSIRRKKLTVLFFPVDCFMDVDNIAEHRAFIDAVRMVCLHTPSLAPYFPNSRLAYVHHYNKYGVRHQDRMPGNYYLWIGGFQFLPYILQALDHFTKFGNVLVLTDHENPVAQAAAKANAARIGIDCFDAQLRKPGVEIATWSEESQRIALLTCGAAFDVKYDACFNQRHKPPTKMQKYLCSGIPCAINDGAALRSQLEIDVPGLGELPHAVANSACQRQRNAYGEKLSTELSLDNIVRRYLILAETVYGEFLSVNHREALSLQL
jgi:hypothetical protein